MSTATRPVDPVDALAARTSERCGPAIDPLQIAAMLESDGMTDSMALADYDYKDVFALAEEVYRRVPRKSPPLPEPTRDWRQMVRELSHGLLYALPSAVFPAVATLLSGSVTIAAMVYATAVGWVWSMSASWVAYRLLGRGRPDQAARALRWSMLLGIVAPTAVAATYMAPGGVALVAGQLGFQLAGGTLLFHKKEAVLFAVTLPAVSFGLLHLLAFGSRAMAVAAVAGAAAAVALAIAAALWVIARVGTVKGPEVRIRGELRGSLPISLYAALSAAYLLSADINAQASLDVALAVTPVVAGMGVLEWRARRYGERVQQLLRRTRYPAEFRRRVYLTFTGGLASAFLALSVLAGILGLALHAAGLLTPAGVTALAGHVLLGGGYFVGFLLISLARFGRLIAILGAVVAGYLAAVAYLGPTDRILIFLICSGVFVSGLVVGLMPGLGQVWRYSA